MYSVDLKKKQQFKRFVMHFYVNDVFVNSNVPGRLQVAGVN